MRIQDGKNSDPASGMEKIQIRDGKNSDPGSRINIPDPHHCRTAKSDRYLAPPT
jgi:hypothetical protein